MKIKIIFILFIIYIYGCSQKTKFTSLDVYRLYETHKDDSLKIVAKDLIEKDCVDVIYFKGASFFYCQNSNLDSSKYYIDKLAQKYPNDVQSIYLLSLINFKQGKFRASQQYSKKLKQLEQEKSLLNKNFYHFVGTNFSSITPIRGYILSSIELKEYSEALKYVNEYISKDTIYRELYWDRYKIKTAMKDSSAQNDLKLYKKYYPNKFGIQNEQMLMPETYTRNDFCWW